MKISNINMILIGAGFIGKRHIEMAKGLDVLSYTGVVDVNRAVAQKIAEQYNIKWYTSLSEAIDELKPDALDICTPTSYHLPAIKQGAKQGIHILCEKPLALDLASAKDAEDIIKKEKVKLMVAQVLRFWPEYIYAVENTHKGTFGKIQSVGCKRLSPAPGWNSWMLRDETGGGAVIDLQLHDMDFILQLLGNPQAIESSGIKTNGGINTVYNKLHYKDCTSITVESCFVMPSSYPFRMYYQIVYEKAVIEFDTWRPAGQQLMVFPVEGSEFCPELPPQTAFKDELSYFAKQLIDNKEFGMVPLSESISALQMCLASRQSCLTNKKVICHT